MNRRLFLQQSGLSALASPAFTFMNAFSEDNKTNGKIPKKIISLDPDGNIAYFETGRESSTTLLPLNSQVMFPNHRNWTFQKHSFCYFAYSQPSLNSHHVILLKSTFKHFEIAIFKYEDEQLVPLVLLCDTDEISPGVPLGTFWNLVTCFSHESFHGALTIALRKDSQLLLLNLTPQNKIETILHFPDNSFSFPFEFDLDTRISFLPNGEKPFLAFLKQYEGIYFYTFQNNQMEFHSQILDQEVLWDEKKESSIYLDASKIWVNSSDEKSNEKDQHNENVNTFSDFFTTVKIENELLYLFTDQKSHLTILKYEENIQKFELVQHVSLSEFKHFVVDWTFYRENNTPYFILLGQNEGTILYWNSDKKLEQKSLNYANFEIQKYLKILFLRQKEQKSAEPTFSFSCFIDDKISELRVDTSDISCWKLLEVKKTDLKNESTRQTSLKKKERSLSLGMMNDPAVEKRETQLNAANQTNFVVNEDHFKPPSEESDDNEWVVVVNPTAQDHKDHTLDKPGQVQFRSLAIADKPKSTETLEKLKGKTYPTTKSISNNLDFALKELGASHPNYPELFELKKELLSSWNGSFERLNEIDEIAKKGFILASAQAALKNEVEESSHTPPAPPPNSPRSPTPPEMLEALKNCTLENAKIGTESDGSGRVTLPPEVFSHPELQGSPVGIQVRFKAPFPFDMWEGRPGKFSVIHIICNSLFGFPRIP